MTEFLTDWGVVVALACAGVAVIYGAVTTRWLLAQSPGNEQMQAISKAVQEGAAAYLNRQYTIIGMVAVVIAIATRDRARRADGDRIRDRRRPSPPPPATSA